MKKKDLTKYLGDVLFHPEQQKMVALTFDDGQILRGKIRSYENEFESNSGKEEIDLDTGKIVYGIVIDEIVSVVELE